MSYQNTIHWISNIRLKVCRCSSLDPLSSWPALTFFSETNKLNKDIFICFLVGSTRSYLKRRVSMTLDRYHESTKISEKIEKGRDGCDIWCCIKSISDYGHRGKVRACIYVCNGKKERGYRVGMEDRSTAFNTTSVTVLFDFKMCAFVCCQLSVFFCTGFFTHIAHRSIVCDCLCLCKCEIGERGFRCNGNQ